MITQWVQKIQQGTEMIENTELFIKIGLFL